MIRLNWGRDLWGHYSQQPKKNIVLIEYVDLIVFKMFLINVNLIETFRFEDENDCRRVQDLI